MAKKTSYDSRNLDEIRKLKKRLMYLLNDPQIRIKIRDIIRGIRIPKEIKMQLYYNNKK